MKPARGVLLCTWGMAAACGSRGGSDDAADALSTRVPVGVALVRRDTISQELSLVGRLVPVPNGSATLIAPAAGVVSEVPVQVGSPVARGTLLVNLDAPDLAASARELRVAAEVAERDARRQAALLREGITSQKNADEKAAAAASARASADAADRLLARTRIASPLSGAVQRVLVHLGEHVEAGTPLVEVIDGRALELIALAPAGTLARLRVGQTAEVTTEGDAQPLPGRVRALAPALDTVTNMGEVVIRISNQDGRVRAGSGAKAAIRLGVRQDVLVVPDSALVLVGDSFSVFVVRPDSTVRARRVSVGVRQATRVEVTGEIVEGDRVVTTGAYGLADGMHVVLDTVAAPSDSLTLQ